MTEQTIGKYVIQEEIGRGAMGVVYRAVDPVIGRTVAVKTIRFDVLTSGSQREEARKRFLREAQSAGGLSHPNIVTIYDVGETEGLSYIAMEYIEGRSLESLLAEGKRWDAFSAAVFAVQIAEALDSAHRKGIVHRDVKPGNILVDAEGRPHLVDFGIARIASSTMTQTSMVMGTPFYMAPEQIAGRKADQRADLFALGAILYEMLTLEKPFGGDTLTTVIYKIMHEEPAPIRSRCGGIPAELDAVVEKLLMKDPDARYASCREVIRDLQPILSGSAAAAGSTSGDPAPAFSGFDPGKTSRLQKTAAEEPPASTGFGRSAAGNRKPLLIVLGLMMGVVLIVGAVLLFSPRRPLRTAAPAGGGSFDVSFSKATLGGVEVKPGPPAAGAQSETPATPQTKDADAASGAADNPPARPGLPISKTETAKPTEIIAGTPSSRERAGSIPPPSGKVESREMSVPTKGMETKAADQGGAGAVSPPAEAVEKKEISPPVGEEEKKPAAVAGKGETRLPRILRQTNPVYPDKALQKRVEGDVTLAITIGPSGRVERAGVVNSIPLLDQAAMEAVKKWEFDPGLFEGTPIQATMEVTIHFGLPAAAAPPKTEEEAVDKGGGKTAEAPKPSLPPPTPPGPEAELAKAAEAMNRAAYRDAFSIAKTLLASHPNLEEAKSISLNAVIQLAPAEIKSLLDQYVLSFKINQPGEFYKAHAAAALSSRLQRDLEMMMSAYRDVQVSASNLTLDFKAARYPQFRTRTVFSQIITGVSQAKNVREVLFEGRYVWTLERRGDEWIIIEFAVE